MSSNEFLITAKDVALIGMMSGMFGSQCLTAQEHTKLDTILMLMGKTLENWEWFNATHLDILGRYLCGFCKMTEPMLTERLHARLTKDKESVKSGKITHEHYLYNRNSVKDLLDVTGEIVELVTRFRLFVTSATHGVSPALALLTRENEDGTETKRSVIILTHKQAA